MSLGWIIGYILAAASFGAIGGVAIMGLIHGPTCERLQDDAYDKGWDTSVLVRSGILRATRWQDSGRSSQVADTGQLYLASAAHWLTRHLDTNPYPEQAECGGHHCTVTDAGLICQSQLGGVCPGAANQRVARSVHRALADGGFWRTALGLLARNAGAHV